MLSLHVYIFGSLSACHNIRLPVCCQGRMSFVESHWRSVGKECGSGFSILEVRSWDHVSVTMHPCRSYTAWYSQDLIMAVDMCQQNQKNKSIASQTHHQILPLASCWENIPSKRRWLWIYTHSNYRPTAPNSLLSGQRLSLFRPVKVSVIYTIPE